MLNEIPGVGHTVAFPSYPAEMMECFNFIESQYASTGIENDLKSSDIKIYPNPAENTLHLRYATSFTPGSIHLINAFGNTLKELDSNHTVVETSSLPRGVYILKFTKGNKVLLKRFVKW
jgi:hypothetical protein